MIDLLDPTCMNQIINEIKEIAATIKLNIAIPYILFV
jgi:hypothetical protein